MHRYPTANVNELTDLFADINKHFRSLPFDAGPVIYLFFVSRLRISEISEIYEFTPAKIHLIIGDFLAGLLSRCKKPQALLMYLPLPGKTSWAQHVLGKKGFMTDLLYKTHLIMECDQPEYSTATRIMDLIEIALNVGTPPVSPQLHARIISNIRRLGSSGSKWHLGEDVTNESETREQAKEVRPRISYRLDQSIGLLSRVKSTSASPPDYFASFSVPSPIISVANVNSRTAMVHQKGKIQFYRATKQHLGNLKAEDFDLFIDIASGETTIRTRCGETITYTGGIPRIGNKSMSLLFTLLSKPGEFLSMNEFQHNTSHMNVCSSSDSLNVRIAMLRKSFRESIAEPWFFLTRRSSAVAFSRQRSYCVVSLTQDLLLRAPGQKS